MGILIESGTYGYPNFGDLAMLLVAGQRIRELCPDASVHVITSAPDSLSAALPDVVPVAVESRRAWHHAQLLPGRLHRRLPDRLSWRLRSLDHALWTAAPRCCSFAIGLKQRITGETRIDVSNWIAEIRSSRLVLVSGMGLFNDAFRDNALGLLERLAFAMRLGIPVALFGQGIGPIGDPRLLRAAGEVLPRARFIGLREGRFSLPLLASLGVPLSRIEVTGDDAIEFAYHRRPAKLGSGVGMNIRVAPYAEVGEDLIPRIRTVLDRVAAALDAPLVPVPVISSGTASSDVLTLRQIADGSAAPWQGEFEMDYPVELVDQIGCCRIVVTGSYHAAVFALAQGIPAVCLEQSAYYLHKFLGLQAQFGTGCAVVPMDQPDLDTRLEAAIGLAWASAGDVRVPLLQAAAQQIERGRAAYSRFLRSQAACGCKGREDDESPRVRRAAGAIAIRRSATLPA